MGIPDSYSSHNSYHSEFWKDLKLTRDRFFYGGVLSSGVAVASAPLDYLKNMIMVGSRPSFRDCLRGVYLTAMNDVPAASIAMSIDFLAKRHFKKKNQDESMTVLQKLITGSIAGTISGLCITPGQMVVLNYQRRAKKNGKTLTMPEISYEVYKLGGLRRLFIGAEFMATREAIYAPAYLALADHISRHVTLFFSGELSLALGAVLAGATAGAMTTPIDFLRVQKQSLALSKGKVLSYPQIYRNFSSSWILFTGLIPRVLTLSFAILCLDEGRRHLFPVLLA